MWRQRPAIIMAAISHSAEGRGRLHHAVQRLFDLAGVDEYSNFLIQIKYVYDGKMLSSIEYLCCMEKITETVKSANIAPFRLLLLFL